MDMVVKTDKKMPILRFPGFIGEWKQIQIEKLVKEGILYKPMDGNHGNIHPKSSDYRKTGIAFVMANDIKNGLLYLKTAKRISKTQADSLQKGFSFPGDVLLTHKGSVGLTAIVPMIDEEYIMLTPQVTYYRVKNKKKLHSIFLRNYFDSEPFQRKLKVLSDSGTRPYIGITSQRQLFIKLPFSLPEQQKIASFLTTIDTRIQQLSRKVDLLEQYKKGVMQQIFSQEIRFKDEQGRDFPDWEEKRLGEVCVKIQDGNYGAIYPKSNEFLEEGIPFLTSKAISGGGALQEDKIDFISKEKHKQLKKAHLCLNDVLFTNRGANVGTIGFVDERVSGGNIGPQLTLLRGNIRIINPFFLKHTMTNKGMAKQIRSQDSGSAMNFFGIKATSKFKIFLPSLPEQKKIANFLDTIDQKINLTKNQLDQTQNFKKGLLQKMFV